MQFQIPLFPHKFELSLPSSQEPQSEQLQTINQIASQLNESLMKEVIEKMHQF